MVLAVHTSGISLPHALALALPSLDALASRCRDALTAQEVIAAVDLERRRIAVEAQAIASRPPPPRPPLLDLFDHPDLGPDRLGLRRVLYQLDRDPAAIHRPPGADTRTSRSAARRVRLPVCGDPDERVLLQWSNFIDHRIDPSSALMLIRPRGRAWLDAVIGEPNGPLMSCLRAGEGAEPPVSKVPFTIDAEFARRADDALAAILRGNAASPPPATSPHSGGLRTAIIVLVLLAVLAAAIFVLVGAGRLPAADGIESPAIAAALQRQRDIVRRTIADQPARTDELRAQLDRAESFLTRLDRSLPRGIRRPDPQPPWLDRLNGELALARERKFERVLAAWADRPLDPAVVGATDDLEREARDFAGLCERAAVFADEMAEVQSLLDNAYGSRERPAHAHNTRAPARPARTIDEITALWTGRARAEPVIRGIVAPVLDRVVGLRAAEAVDETDVLIAAVRDPDLSRPELALASWRRLGERPGVLWPATLAELDLEASAATGLRSVVAALPDASRRAQLTEFADRERARRLVRFLSFSSNVQDVEQGFSRLAEFGVNPADLDPWLRYNLFLRELRTAAARLGEEDLRREIAAFKRKVSELPGGVTFRSEVAPLLVDLDLIASGREPDALPSWYHALGPASTGRYTAALDGDRLVFTLNPEFADLGRTFPLEFVLVPSPPGSDLPPFFIGTTEVSVGMLASIHTAAAAESSTRTPRLSRYLTTFANDDDPRFGPRSWEWDPTRTAIRPAREWLLHPSGRVSDDYAPGQVPARPAEGSPVQHLSPVAAACLASLVGCRLPTADEWLAAASAFPEDPGAYNLRDQTWARHRDLSRRLAASGRPTQAPTAGAFDNGGPDRDAAAPTDDGQLWFAPVDLAPSPRPLALIGNVAEYVLHADLPFPADPLDPKLPNMLAAHPRAFSIIGGSALSDPGQDPRSPRPVVLPEAAEGFADVGFRLAFSGRHIGPEAHTLAARLERLLTPTPYLKGK